MEIKEVKFLDEATHVKFEGLNYTGTIDGKLYEIINKASYLDEDGDMLNVMGWKEFEHEVIFYEVAQK